MAKQQKRKHRPFQYQQLYALPHWANWIAFDRSGKCFYYEQKPTPTDFLQEWLQPLGTAVHLCGYATEDISDIWEDTLTEIIR